MKLASEQSRETSMQGQTPTEAENHPSGHGATARVDDDMRVYAIGDIHGRSDLLRHMMQLIDRDSNAASPVRQTVLVFIGDYVDRGPDSAGVIDLLLQVTSDPGYTTYALKGNHEVMFLEFLSNPTALFQWAANGGAETLESYGIDVDAAAHSSDGAEKLRRTALSVIPDEHLAFLSQLETAVQIGDYLFVHAGVRPGVPLEAQDEHDMIWIREPFLDHSGGFGKVVVHGHTPVREPEVKTNRIDIDTLAWRSGQLTALVLENGSMRFLST